MNKGREVSQSQRLHEGGHIAREREENDKMLVALWVPHWKCVIRQGLRFSSFALASKVPRPSQMNRTSEKFFHLTESIPYPLDQDLLGRKDNS